jgi:flagellar basal body rod protein FlgF
MPTYNFLNKETNEIEEHRMSYTVLDQFKLDNPNLELQIFAQDLPVFSDAGRMSVPGTNTAVAAFEHGVIERMKATIPGNTLAKSHKTKLPREW